MIAFLPSSIVLIVPPLIVLDLSTDETPAPGETHRSRDVSSSGD
jgi:hypothetical protein